MISKIFRVNIVLRLLLVFILGNGALYLILQTPYWMLSVWLLIFLIIGIVELLKYIEKNYRSLGTFLMGIQQNDFSYIANIRNKTHDSGLGKAFSHIADMVEKLRLEAETNYQYLQTVVNHIDIGILCYDNTGKMNMVNNAVFRFFHLNKLHHIGALEKINKGFYDLIINLKPGEKKVYPLDFDGNIYQLAVMATHFRKEKTEFKLVSFQNIKGELEEKEMESWYRLTRVLTHEIMNSAIPISNLTSMISETIISESEEFRDLSELDVEEKKELRQSLKTIESRSKGLVNFVNSTRKITRLPEPKRESTHIDQLLEGVFSLFAGKLKEKHISCRLENNMQRNPASISVDPEQMERVFINLLQNAIDATVNVSDPQVTVTLESRERSSIHIRFGDNGKGMTQEEKENLFVPFFTTKNGGTGIGMSLSRHIIHNHQGTIDVKTEKGKGTEFIIELPVVN